MQKSANSCAKIIRRQCIFPHEIVCKRKLTLTMLHCFNRLYLQHGGGSCCSQNDVTVTLCHPVIAFRIDA